MPAENMIPAQTTTIRELREGEDATAFRTLNEEWISRYFVLEAKDREQLEHPERLLARGARIFLATRDGNDVGCVALVPMAEGVFELSKMAVSPEMRGQGIGRTLLLHAIGEARAAGARSLFLGSNTRLVSAVTLYESAGFRHVAPDRLPKLAYSRANVFMELELQ